MTLHDAIAAANAIFLDLNAFAENVTHLPSGVVANGVVYQAIVDWSGEDGGGVNYRNHTGAKGTGRIRETVASIELAASVYVVGGGRDKFVVTDPQSGSPVTLTVSDELGRDSAMQTWSLKRIGVREPSRSNYRGD